MKCNVEIIDSDMDIRPPYWCESCGKSISQKEYIDSIFEFDFHLCSSCQHYESDVREREGSFIARVRRFLRGCV